ncbi:antitoxin VbhA family protein [Microbacterium sp. NPDC090225]|uniref:antitoxin VbhA family protein n=1 Tax=Microbacterium sp. NPDC090225 TaxID=3364207 RepID=UPI00382C5F8E
MSESRSREERLAGVLEAFHSCRLDALKPSRAAIRDGWDYIEGRRTLDEIIDDVVRRHTRDTDQEQP